MNRNKLFIVIIFIIIGSLFSYNLKIKKKNSGNKEEGNKLINIEFVDFDLLTPIDVECELFNLFFSKTEVRVIEIKDDSIINKFLEIILKLNHLDSIYNQNIDTRAKVQIILPFDSIIMCIGGFSLKICDEVYKTPQNLIDLIESLNNGNESVPIPMFENRKER